jgi:hypothetical protein
MTSACWTHWHAVWWRNTDIRLAYGKSILVLPPYPCLMRPTVYVTSCVSIKNVTLYMIWGFHCGDYEECRLLGYKNGVRTSQETHNISVTEPSQLMLCKIWDFHGGDYEECRLLGCYAVWLYKNQRTTSECAPIASYWYHGSYLAESFVLMTEATLFPKRQFLQEPNQNKSQKTAFFTHRISVGHKCKVSRSN